MTHDELQEPFRTPTDAHRLEAMGFFLAEQVVTPDARAREGRNQAFRADMAPLRELLRPHVFSECEARDAACRSPMPGGVFALEPVGAGELGFRWRTACLFAVGHGIDHHGFEEVASAIADPEIVSLVEQRMGRGAPDGARHAHSIVLTVSGAHYQLLIDEEGEPEVRAKAPFGIVSEDEVARTATWLLERLMGRLDVETELDREE